MTEKQIHKYVIRLEIDDEPTEIELQRLKDLIAYWAWSSGVSGGLRSIEEEE